MEKEFIPYEQALALKELGFDEPCFTYFGNISQALFGLKGRIEFHTNTLLDIGHGKNVVSSAPTFSQVFRWFREKYGLCSYVDRVYDKGFYIYEYFIDKDYQEFGLKSYEEAELDCLKKLIEIVKKK